ncbi:MAG: hypothetical protein JNM71_14515 [Flavobacterium lindanitolerans]|jgi:uncharacterized membrane protein|uniref:hypothetical protein n=2 Tax=Flavobacterium TaxID=237 RepID=UPI001A4E69D2|nr:hypothetical protein [Flavobacterium lindanitolerans]MBL7869227.1 hypothetical protein [Flavobacterium lindanitolerans]
MQKITTTKEKIEEIKQRGYPLEFGEILSQALNNYQKIVWIAGAGVLLLSIVFFAIIMGLAAIFIGLSTFGRDIADFQIQNFSAAGIIVALVGGAIAVALIKPFYAGILRVAHHADAKEDFDFSTLFYYYKSEYLKEIIIAGILIGFCSNGISTALELTGNTILGSVISYIIILLTLFTTPLIIFGNLKAIEAIQASLMLVSRNFFMLLALMIVAVILAGLGVFAFCIGILFTIPLIFSVQYMIYTNVIGIDEKNELEEIGNSSSDY